MPDEILVHTCCGPCAVKVLDALRAEGHNVVPHFFNPNVHPLLEFVRRLEAFEQLCAHRGLSPVISADYGLETFLECTAGRRNVPERCRGCVSLRLDESARVASERGIRAYTSTLLISIYQDHDAVRELGIEAGTRHGVEFVYRDFRPLFREGQTAAKEMGLYRQPYCGCIFSEAERYAGRLAQRASAARSQKA